MSPLHKFPFGLLGRFALKTLGDAPNKFGDQVTPVYDIGAEYALDTQVVLEAGPTNMAALGDTLTLTVPEGYIYDILAVGFFTAHPSTTTVASIIEINISGVCVANSDPVDDYVRANPYEVNLGWCPPQRFLLGPGGTINGILRSTPNATMATLLRAFIRKIEQ